MHIAVGVESVSQSVSLESSQSTASPVSLVGQSSQSFVYGAGTMFGEVLDPEVRFHRPAVADGL